MQDDPLADFLTARWGLHTRRFGRTFFLPNNHERWPLVTADLLSLDDDLLATAGLPGLSTVPPDSVLFSTRRTHALRRAAAEAGWGDDGGDSWRDILGAPKKVDQSRHFGSGSDSGGRKVDHGRLLSVSDGNFFFKIKKSENAA